MDKLIIQIIDRKKAGIDCTEQESAEIKGWLKELREVGEQKYVAEIQRLFPREYDEALTEEEEENDWTRDYSEDRDHESYQA